MSKFERLDKTNTGNRNYFAEEVNVYKYKLNEWMNKETVKEGIVWNKRIRRGITGEKE